MLGPHLSHYEILQPFDNSQQHKVEIYSAIGQSQELISEIGVIDRDGVPININPSEYTFASGSSFCNFCFSCSDSFHLNMQLFFFKGFDGS